MHTLRVPQRQGIRIPHPRMSGLHTVTSFLWRYAQPRDLHRDSHCGKLFNNDVNPCSLTEASGGNSNGRFRSAIITIEQYAPLDLDELWLVNLRLGIACLTSTSPPTETAKPPSGCLTLPNHFHLECHRQCKGLESQGVKSCPHGSSVNEVKRFRSSHHRQAKHYRIGGRAVRGLSMSAPKATIVVLERCEGLYDPVKLVSRDPGVGRRLKTGPDRE